MKIRFADRLPAGDYALAVPVAGKDRAPLERLGADRAALEAALTGQRFEGEASTAAEHFLATKDGVRRVLEHGFPDTEGTWKEGGRVPSAPRRPPDR